VYYKAKSQQLREDQRVSLQRTTKRYYAYIKS